MIKPQVCSNCKVLNPSCGFYNNQHYCKDCAKEYRHVWYMTLPNRQAKRIYYGRTEDKPGQYKRRAEKAWTIRLEMIVAYGNKCSCCGEQRPQFLTLEHLLGGGNSHRDRLSRASATWRELKSQGWPQEGFTLLCWNCQMSKTHFGVCVHEQERQNDRRSAA